jgi:hypothetical protein
MHARRLISLLLFYLPVYLTGTPPLPAWFSHASLNEQTAPLGISAPRQSIPAPVHDEATCAFCQAAAFAPHASSPGCALFDAPAAERHECVSSNDRLTFVGSLRPPSTRAPPALRDS